MEIDFDTVVKSLDGVPLTLKDSATGEEKEIDLKIVTTEALLNPKTSIDVTAIEKMVRFVLAQKVHEGGMIILTSEEIVLIKKLISVRWTTLIVGQTYKMFESK